MTIDVTAENGTPFRVRYLPEGSKSYPKPLVRFFDRSADLRFGPDGQKVCDLTLDTVLAGTVGLMLDLSVPQWQVDAETMTTVREWLAQVTA